MTWFILTTVAVFFVAIETIFEKKTLVIARTMEFSAMFAFGNALVSLPFLFVTDYSQINLFVIGMIVVSALPSAGATLLVFKTLKHNELSEAAPILALSPLVVTFMAFISLNEKISMMQLLGIMMIVGAMIFLELKNMKSRSGIFRKGRGKYIFYVCLCLFLGGVSTIFDRYILYRLGVNSLTYIVLTQLVIAMFYVIFFLLKPKFLSSLKENAAQSWKIIFLISVMTVAHRYMYASAIQVASGIGLVSAIYKLSALANVFSGGSFFEEKGIVRKGIACIVILVGTVLLVLK